MSSVAFHTGAEPIPGYRLLDRLGSGGFGEVWRCEAPGGIYKAVKVIHGDLRQTDTEDYRFAEQELKSLKRVKQVRHPYLVALDRFDIVDGRLVIVMELADCNLWDRFRQCREAGLHGIPRDELLLYMAETAEVLDLMNDKYQLQHLDIKPQNLFLLYNHVKVADFGQVKDLEKHVAQVTGGITPVYAAPETFDGFVSRYCDQYSLACVYQELLTGVRPFNGTSMNQLLMQHLAHAPNLDPSPPADRPALARALSKKAEDRFPSVAEMVSALRSGSAVKVSASLASAVAVGGSHGLQDAEPYSFADSPPSPMVVASATAVSTGLFAPEVTPYPKAEPVPAMPPERDALPEHTGPGELRPAVVIGIGYAGRRVLQRFTQLLAEEGGSARRLPHVRTLYIDTHPDAVSAAANSTDSAFSAIPADCILHTPLNRAAHYLRPRNNGRAIIEGWLDGSVLYRLPRIPATTGLRALGRLALWDHQRAIIQRIQAELDQVLDPAALSLSEAACGRQLRTNRPRVYLVAGLGGGTGGGMLFDMAYLVRQQLHRFGHTSPDVVGVLMVPPAEGEVSQLARANTYAALTELHHFSHPETAFVADTDDGALIRDNDPPFARTVLLKGYEYAVDVGSVTQTHLPRRKPPSGASTAKLRPLDRPTSEPSADPALVAADYLRFDLFTPIGRTADTTRGDRPSAVAAVGGRRFTWPKHAVVMRVSRVIAPVLIQQWLGADQPSTESTKWAAERWNSFGLTPDVARKRLRAVADADLGEEVNAHLLRMFNPLTPKGWLAKLPEPAAVGAAVNHMVSLFGPPRETPGRGPGPIAVAIAAEARRMADETARHIAELVPALLDTPGFRMAGAEEVCRRLLLLAEEQLKAVRGEASTRDAKATTAYDRLLHYTSSHKGVKKPNAAELGDALRDYADSYEAVVNRNLTEVYTRVLESLVARVNDLAQCRQRLTAYLATMASQAEQPLPEIDPGRLLPAGCKTQEEAAQRYLASLDDQDLSELEQRFQRRVNEELGGVYEACMNTGDGPELLCRLLRDTTRDYLNSRLGEVDVAGMMRAEFGTPAGVAEALDRAYGMAEPGVAGRGPWAKDEVCVFAAPAGAAGASVTHAAMAVLPTSAVLTHTPDEVAIYREWPQVPLTALDQLGPAWESSYRAAPDLNQTSAHTRTDITQWLSVDG